MPATAIRRSLPTSLAIGIGVAVFAAGLAVSIARNPSPGVHAQEGCAQPSESGCGMALDTPVQAALADPATVHNWLLDVAVNNDFTVVLTNLAADLELVVYGPDDSILGLDAATGLQDKIAHIRNIGPGRYWIVVDSVSGEASETPYSLVANTQATVPFTSYGAGRSFATY